MRNNIQRESIRDEILDATDKLLARFGYKKMTIDDLAHEVGIGKGTIYLHFASKEEIALSHIDRIIERMKIRLREISNADVSPDERLREMLLTRVLFRFDSVQHYTQSLNDLLADLRPRFLARRRRYFEDEAQIFAEVLQEGDKIKTFSVPDTLKTAETLLLATNSLLPYSLNTKELGERSEIEERVRRLADLLLTGLLRR
ncbi:MAG: TetR/AcrR family transcriptional regulator [Acidobacteriota bacterium]|nr:TetR/AcrR family transcriptional regulator [Acidobacteriota bacterium]